MHFAKSMRSLLLMLKKCSLHFSARRLKCSETVRTSAQRLHVMMQHFLSKQRT